MSSFSFVALRLSVTIRYPLQKQGLTKRSDARSDCVLHVFRLGDSDVLVRTRWHLTRCSRALGRRSGVADLHERGDAECSDAHKRSSREFYLINRGVVVSWRKTGHFTYYSLLSLAGVSKPQRPRMPWRNFSRSSGVMRSQRSAMRRPESERRNPRPLTPPKRIRHKARRPTACQKVIRRQPKSGGSSQFHRCNTISPPMKIKSAIATIPTGIMKISFFHLGLIFSPSRFRKLVVDTLQSLAQMQHRIAFA